MSEARVDRLEAEIGERLRRVEEAVIRIEATLTASQPHLATKAELADLHVEMATGFGDLAPRSPTSQARPSWRQQSASCWRRTQSDWPGWRRYLLSRS
jgi:hypothetical protein